MATIFARLRLLGFSTLDLKHKVFIGKLLAAAYQRTGIKECILRKESRENGAVYTVLDYPPAFREEMDLRIKKYCADNGIQPVIKKKKPNARFQKKTPFWKEPQSNPNNGGGGERFSQDPPRKERKRIPLQFTPKPTPIRSFRSNNNNKNQ